MLFRIINPSLPSLKEQIRLDAASAGHSYKPAAPSASIFLFSVPTHSTMASQLEQQPTTTTTTTPQQPLMMYPYNVPGQPPPTSRPHSDGSFGGVFIVLAVVVLVSAVACCLGRFCGRRHEKPKAVTKKKAVKAGAAAGAGGARFPKEIDIEFGFDHKNLRTANRPVRYGEYKGNNNSKPGSDGGFTFDLKKGNKTMPSNDYDFDPRVGP